MLRKENMKERQFFLFKRENNQQETKKSKEKKTFSKGTQNAVSVQKE